MSPRTSPSLVFRAPVRFNQSPPDLLNGEHKPGHTERSQHFPIAPKTLILSLPTTGLTGIGLTILGESNVIVRNMKISKVLADYGDCVTIQASSNVWVDSSDFSSDLDNGKDYYDGLVDTVHASEWVSITNNYFHDHVSLFYKWEMNYFWYCVDADLYMLISESIKDVW